MIHSTCNMGARDSPDMYALSPRACGPRAYISGKSLAPMLQLLHVHACMYTCIHTCMHVCSYVYMSCAYVVVYTIWQVACSSHRYHRLIYNLIIIISGSPFTVFTSVKTGTSLVIVNL